MSDDRDYVLGTHDDEITRLGLQHAVWRPRATDAWRRAGFRTGQTLLDVGCGPGYAALDLADIVGPGGRVIAVDRSRRFLDALEAAAAARGRSWIETREQDLDESELPDAVADGVWSRWVYAFVKQPKRLLGQAARALKPGGAMVLHEYGDYRGWRVSPRSAVFEEFVVEVMASWREAGGEPDIGLELPGWLEELGFELRALAPICEIARPDGHLWQWPRAFMQVGLERLVALGRIGADRAAAMRAAFRALEQDPRAFQVTPMVIEIVAVKRPTPAR